MKFSVSLSIFMSLVGAAATATATPLFYGLNFTTTTGLAPYIGAFLYDAETGLFPAFIVGWGGRAFDLTSAVNNPLAFGGCDLSPSGGSGYLTFAALVFGPTLGCPGEMVWTANEISPGAGNFGFAKNNISIGPGVGPIETGPFPLSSGGISASPRVPEPSTVVLMITGGALLAWRRRVVHRSTRSQQ